MMYVLLIMFFITPPNNILQTNKDTKQDHRVWTLQSTTVMDFNTEDQCKKVQKEIKEKMNTTNTLTIRAWCFGKGAAGAQIEKFKEEGGQDPNLIEPLK